MYLLILLFLPFCIGSKILVTVGGVSGSHNMIMQRFAEQLAERGHNVSMLRLEFDPDARKIDMNNVKEYVVRDLMEKDFLEVWKDQMRIFDRKEKTYWEYIKLFYNFIGWWNSLMRETCEKVYSDEKLMHSLRDSNFDAVVIHIIDYCSIGIAQDFGINATVWFSPLYLLDYMATSSGISSPASWVGSNWDIHRKEWTIFNRFINLLTTAASQPTVDYILGPTMDSVYRKHFGHDFPTFSVLMGRMQLLLVNADQFFEPPRPIGHNVLYVGGLTMKAQRPLPQEWMKRLEHPTVLKNGFGLFSLGTVANTAKMPMEMKEAIVKALSRLPQKFFVRLEGELPDIAAYHNIEFVKWIPQRDLLSHKSIKLFITHAGYNSITEATFAGVPLVALPLFGDQTPNAARIERAHMGISLNIQEITEELLYSAAKTVLSDPTYAANASRIGQMIRKKPVSSLETAMSWVEFLAEFKQLPLKPAASEMSTVELYNLDLLFIAHLVVFILIFAIWKITCLCCRRKSKTD